MYLFIIPLIVAVVTQVIKLTIEAYQGTFDWRHVYSYGGMPSSHAALVTSLSTAIGYYEGILNPAFAVSLVLLIIVVRDAMGFRYQLGIHAKIINSLIKELPDREEYRYPILSESLGHTPLEVSVGVVVGFASSMILIWILH